MIIVVAALLAILTVPLTGASLGPMARLPIYSTWLIWASMAAQMVITIVPGFPNSLGQPVHMLTLGMAAAFMWSNRHLCGSILIAFGAGLNAAAILANNGTMPASRWAWRDAGFAEMTSSFENSNVVGSARLWWLGDIFAIPASWPLSNVFSFGDIIIVIGVGYFAHRSCRQPSLPELKTAPVSAVAEALSTAAP